MIGGILQLDNTDHIAALTIDDGTSTITVPMIVDPTHMAPYSAIAAAQAWQIYRNYPAPCPITVNGVLTTDANGFHCIHL